MNSRFLRYQVTSGKASWLSSRANLGLIAQGLGPASQCEFTISWCYHGKVLLGHLLLIQSTGLLPVYLRPTSEYLLFRPKLFYTSIEQTSPRGRRSWFWDGNLGHCGRYYQLLYRFKVLCSVTILFMNNQLIPYHPLTVFWPWVLNSNKISCCFFLLIISKSSREEWIFQRNFPKKY